MKNKVKYIQEIYTDEYHTLMQAIIWDVNLDKASNGKERRYAKASINPNLTILLRRRYLDETAELIKEEKF